LGKCFSSRPAGDDMASETVVIPLSQEPLCEASGIFWGTLAFPSDPNKRDRFAKAWCRESFRLSAVENADFARTPQLLKPGYFIMRDSEVDAILAEGQRQIEHRRKAYIATQAAVVEALLGIKIDFVRGFGDKLKHTADNCYTKTNIWLQKPAGVSNKPLIRDAITPSRPVIHAVNALWCSIDYACDQKLAKNEDDACRQIFENADIFAALLHEAEATRRAVIKHAALKLTEADMIQFVAV
jgi:hypothetical protein